MLNIPGETKRDEEEAKALALRVKLYKTYQAHSTTTNDYDSFECYRFDLNKLIDHLLKNQQNDPANCTLLTHFNEIKQHHDKDTTKNPLNINNYLGQKGEHLIRAMQTAYVKGKSGMFSWFWSNHYHKLFSQRKTLTDIIKEIKNYQSTTPGTTAKVLKKLGDAMDLYLENHPEIHHQPPASVEMTKLTPP